MPSHILFWLKWDIYNININLAISKVAFYLEKGLGFVDRTEMWAKYSHV